MSKYLSFIDKTDFGAKTKKISVQNKLTGSILGEIKWYPPFRKYTFSTISATVFFDADCLNDIVSYLTKLSVERKIELQNAKTDLT